MKKSIRNEKCVELKSRIAKKEAKLNKLYSKLKGAEESQQHKAIDHLEYFLKKAEPKFKNVRVLVETLKEERQSAQ